MRPSRSHAILALVGALALAACGETDVADLQFDDLTPEEQAELAVLADPGSFDVSLELTEATHDVASSLGDSRANTARNLNAQARTAFLDARAAMQAGDGRRALDAARQARRLVAEALRELGGDAALEALIVTLY